MNNKSARVRQQAADLVGRIATVLKVCKEESLLKDLGKTLFEFLGEEYPDVLGSIIGALKGKFLRIMCCMSHEKSTKQMFHFTVSY